VRPAGTPQQTATIITSRISSGQALLRAADMQLDLVRAVQRRDHGEVDELRRRSSRGGSTVHPSTIP
jgi:hypothetical protein